MMGEQRDRAYGKGARLLLANLAACRDVVIWAIDLRRGAALRPWAPCPGRLATTPAEAAALRADAVTLLFARSQHLAGHGKRERQPSPAMPALVIIINVSDDAPDAMSDTGTVARLGRAPAVTLAAVTQAPSARRRRLRRPDGTRLLAHGEMTIRNRECKVQVLGLTCVSTYSGTIGSCTCTKPPSCSVTNRNHRPRRFATNRGGHRA
jgi:hypothetical protein